MKKVFAVTAVLALLCLGGIAQADVFNMGEGLTNLETVTVGDPGNVGELSGLGAGGFGPNRICGAVNYVYNIGKYEVTTAQYCDFLNHKALADPYGLYGYFMGPYEPGYPFCNIQRHGEWGSFSYTVGDGSSQDVAAWGNRPIVGTTYWNALRFINWVNNGQGDGDTETGAYSEITCDGRTIRRNAGARWFLASEDEWYKAAYYKGGGTNAGYWDYATQSDIHPSNVGADGYFDPGNHANYEVPHELYTLGPPTGVRMSESSRTRRAPMGRSTRTATSGNGTNPLYIKTRITFIAACEAVRTFTASTTMSPNSRHRPARQTCPGNITPTSGSALLQFPRAGRPSSPSITRLYMIRSWTSLPPSTNS
ncbi:MAG: SUMF1/EgtB/PvdO family nonheme iron enzyme [Armatimonadota bacterium]|nr:SUMF1/EgtB/PvdO family nonheme iron enzyme [Armatimonadota bacterium]